MSRRTAEASKAISTAWENEQMLVKDGKGTRDWTPEQQKDILERGKAYDENGRAFEGQHMRSVAEHPECQGDPNNIQFLTREEHLEAHDGDWKNPTNWYFDPVTKTKHDFGDGPVIPCTVLELSQPIYVQNISKVEKTEEDTPKEPTVKEQGNTKVPLVQDNPNIQGSPRPIMQQTPSSSPSPLKGILMNVFKAIGRGVGNAISNSYNWSGPSNNDSHNSVNRIKDTTVGADSPVSNNLSQGTIVNRNYPETRSSPRLHMVGKVGDGQHYNTKHGKIFKEKAPYPRGGKHSDE